MLLPSLPSFSKGRQSKRKRPAIRLGVELLEARDVPATFTVVNLNDGGAGSLRRAINDANANPGADVIDFDVAGTVRLTTAALPAVTDAVNIDGTSATGFAGTPVVEVDFNRFNGLRFNGGAAGSALRALGLVNAAGNGVTINNGGNILVVGNYIGVRLNGVTAFGNTNNGLEIIGLSGNTVGGTTPEDLNVISGNRGNGILLTGSSDNTIAGNYIGTTADGGAALGNFLDGVKLVNSHGNLIGHNDPVTGVTYYDAQDVPTQPVSGWQGIRNSDTDGEYLIVGSSHTTSTTNPVQGVVFEGTIAGTGTSSQVNVPFTDVVNTSIYGPDNLDGCDIRLVGTYTTTDTSEVAINGFLFEGKTDDLGQAANYRTINYPDATYTYLHSTMGGLVVGNYDNPLEHGDFDLPYGPGHATIYDIASEDFLTDIVFPGSVSNSVYGIWYNGGTSYTLCGGYSPDPKNNFDDQDRPLDQGFMVDFDSATLQFSNWASFSYPNGVNVITHFEGISSVEKGVYTLNADSLEVGSTDPAQGSWLTVRRNADGSFGPATWVDLNYTGLDPETSITSSNSVYGNQVVGVVIGPDATAFQATVNIAFQLSNVVSANGGNGITLESSNDNIIAMNYIGTDVSGKIDLGNANNGVQVKANSRRNVIGGQATDGNDPTNGVFARPPQGNLISGNNANGVLINNGSTKTLLSGNFIGTDECGNGALGNTLDGVAIKNANGNSLIGCIQSQDPFVFYNVISGNGGNGLRVTDSNDTTIQANFFGIGADNDTAVPNLLNGVVVEGTSATTTMGGVIPLGNVTAANGKNGLVVRGTASGFISFNTFAGVAAFTLNMDLGNGLDGMRITSTGGNNLIRTNVISRNGDDGIEVSGNARGVQVVQNIIGLNTDGTSIMGNVDNGVEVGGDAHDIVVGGPQPSFSIITHNAISGNGGNGVAVVGNAHDVRINFSYIGTDIFGLVPLGNAGAGVFLGTGTHSTTIGSPDPRFLTVISGNTGNGVEMRGTTNNKIVGSLIGANSSGEAPMGNGGNGVYISDGFDNVIGGISSGVDSPANVIAFNAIDGVFVDSGNRNGIHENSIFLNNGLGINLNPWANNGQVPPVLTSVAVTPLRSQVSGFLNSKPNTTFTIEVFANFTGGPSGRYFLGSMKVKTNAAGFATFTFLGAIPPPGANFFTATATDSNDNTSMFSEAISLLV